MSLIIRIHKGLIYNKVHMIRYLVNQSDIDNEGPVIDCNIIDKLLNLQMKYKRLEFGLSHSVTVCLSHTSLNCFKCYA